MVYNSLLIHLFVQLEVQNNWRLPSLSELAPKNISIKGVPSISVFKGLLCVAYLKLRLYQN